MFNNFKTLHKGLVIQIQIFCFQNCIKNKISLIFLNIKIFVLSEKIFNNA